MTSKLLRARESILQFIKTANPEDEVFVIGFNDRPELIEDFTNSVEDIQARLATVRSGHRTALLDAIYYGVAKMKDARHERKAEKKRRHHRRHTVHAAPAKQATATVRASLDPTPSVRPGRDSR